MKELSSLIDKVCGRYAIFARYFISGGTSFGTDIIALFLLTEILHIYYLTSAILAFIIAFVVSFLMMKHWTFQDGSIDRTHKQLTIYFGVAIFNLLLNTLLVYLFVAGIHLWYIFAQVIASLLIAISSFLIYKYIIFVQSVINNHEDSNPNPES